MYERTLILLRHAKSDWSGSESDIDRPLAPRGRRQAPDAGQWLRRNVTPIGLVLSSPAVRARRTWDLASTQLDEPPPVRIDDRVYAASPDQLLAVVRDLPDDLDTVALVGHNPGIEELVPVLTGAPARMRTSEIAVVGLAGPWSEAGRSRGRLRALGRPPADL